MPRMSQNEFRYVAAASLFSALFLHPQEENKIGVSADTWEPVYGACVVCLVSWCPRSNRSVALAANVVSACLSCSLLKMSVAQLSLLFLLILNHGLESSAVSCSPSKQFQILY